MASSITHILLILALVLAKLLYASRRVVTGWMEHEEGKPYTIAQSLRKLYGQNPKIYGTDLSNVWDNYIRIGSADRYLAQHAR